MRQIKVLLAAVALAFPFGAQAQDTKAGESALKTSGCLKCHSVSAEKDGPSYKAWPRSTRAKPMPPPSWRSLSAGTTAASRPRTRPRT